MRKKIDRKFGSFWAYLLQKWLNVWERDWNKMWIVFLLHQCFHWWILIRTPCITIQESWRLPVYLSRRWFDRWDYHIFLLLPGYLWHLGNKSSDRVCKRKDLCRLMVRFSRFESPDIHAISIGQWMFPIKFMVNFNIPVRSFLSEISSPFLCWKECEIKGMFWLVVVTHLAK